MVPTFPCSPSARVMAGVLTGGLLLSALVSPATRADDLPGHQHRVGLAALERQLGAVRREGGPARVDTGVSGDGATPEIKHTVRPTVIREHVE